MGKEKLQIFISYAREDEALARKLYQDLAKKGLNPWLDKENILPGQNWRIAIRKALKESDYIILLLSQKSLSKKGYVQEEQKMALELLDECPPDAILVIPVRLDPCEPVDERIQNRSWVDLFPEYETGFKQILKVFDSELPDELFIGRENYIKKLLDNTGSHFLFGARRMGKTSLFKYMESIYWTKQIPAFYLSIQGYQEAEKIKRKIRLCFKRRQFYDDESLFEKNNFFDFLEELDVMLSQSIVFLIDETEQIIKIEKREPGFIDKFRNCVESLNKICFILTASPHFKKLIAEMPCSCSTFLSAFKTIDILTPMERTEIIELIQKLMPVITPAEIEQILQFTHFHPFLAKIFINKLKKNGKLNPINREAARDAYVSNALDGIMPNYFEGLNSDDQNIVIQIFLRQFQFSEKYQTKLLELAKYGYLKYENDQYHISNWFFEHWLKNEYENKIEK